MSKRPTGDDEEYRQRGEEYRQRAGPHRPRAMSNFKTCGIVLSLGVVVTVGACMLAGPGGPYVVTYGVFVAGAIFLLRGAWFWAKRE